MDLEYKPTPENIALSKELDEIVTASIKWILEKDLGAMEQMTRLQFWFRKAYDQGKIDSIKIDSIKTATPEELMQSESVKKLVEALRNIKSTSKKDLTENPGYWGEMIVGEAMQALKKFEVKK